MHGLHESPVEGRVVCQHGHTTHKVGQLGHGILGAGRVLHVAVGYAGEPHNLRRDGDAGMDEGVHGIGHFAARQAGGAYLYEVAVAEGEARGLGIEHHDVLLQEAEVLRARPLGQRQVAFPDALGCPGKQQVIDRQGRFFFCHAMLLPWGWSRGDVPRGRTPRSACTAPGTRCHRGVRSRAGGSSLSCRGSCWSPG